MSALAQDGDLVQLQGSGYKSHILRLKAGEVLQTHRGVIRHDAVIGQPWGSSGIAHRQPILSFSARSGGSHPRNEAYHPDSLPERHRLHLLVMGVGPGKRVLEAGTGSGGLTTAFAYMVGETGKVVSYERKPEVQALARANLSRLGFENRVDFKLGDAEDGFTERDVDALFLDLPNPYDYIGQAKASLKGGGYLGILVPTVNQVSRCLQALKLQQFAFVEVCEILLRFFKTDWDRLRPVDRMVAHTGYLIFGRSVFESSDELFDGEVSELA